MKKLISTQWIDNFLSPEEYTEIMELSNTIQFLQPWEYADKYGDSKHPDPTINFNWRAWRGCRRSLNLINFLDVGDKIGELFDCDVGRLEYFEHPVENFPDYVPNPPQGNGAFQNAMIQSPIYLSIVPPLFRIILVISLR